MDILPVNPKMKLTFGEVQFVLTEQPILKNAERLVSVPWQAIAAIWYRESFSIAPPDIPGGQFQFDPVPSSSQLGAMLARYVVLSASDLQALVKRGVNEFSSACLFAACHLRDVARYDLALDQSDEAIKDAFYGYNGRGYGPSPDDSPYVMNNFDAAHLNMRIVGSEPDGHGGRIRVDTIDLRPGAFTVYKQLSLIDTKTGHPP
jgi:hypothetical protein